MTNFNIDRFIIRLLVHMARLLALGLIPFMHSWVAAYTTVAVVLLWAIFDFMIICLPRDL